MALPTFDYEGSLELARQLLDAADQAATAVTDRHATRDVALDPATFQGPYGDHHRTLAADEDDAVQPLLDACEDAATGWANSWADAVNEYNQSVYDDAVQQMRRLNDSRRHWHRMRIVNAEPGDWIPPLQLGWVVPPRPANPPAATDFQPDAPSFAMYVPDGLNLVPNYQDSP